MAEPVRYRVDLTDRVHHLVHVTMHVPDDLHGQQLRVVLPTWTPGSYVIRDYVHDVQSIRATVDGEPLALTPDGHTAWTLECPVEGEVAVELEVYGHAIGVRNNHIDDHHALLIPPATFPWIEGTANRPHEVEIDTTEPVWSMLPDDGNVHRASDYLHLVDSAFDVGDHPVVTWENADVEHRFVWTGRTVPPDLDRLAEDAQKTIDATIELFGGDLPTDRYTFLCGTWDQGGGGLEHRDGATLLIPAHIPGDADGWARLQSLIAHEYLHLWNVKRLTPSALVDPDLERPTHTESLWVAEGWTSYWDELLPLRAGVWTADRWLKSMAESVDTVTRQPGRQRQTLREASHQAWVKHYVRDENTVNVGTDYYRHGAVVAFALDMEIRRRQPGGSLDQVMRLLWERHGRSTDGYTESDVEDATTTVTGSDMTWFFDRFVGGHDLPDFDEAAATVGIEPAPPKLAEQVPWLGVQTAEAPTGIRLTAVLRDGPGWSGGLAGDDILLAVGGHRVTTDNLDAVLSMLGAGRTVRCHVLRGPNLLEQSVTLGDPHPPTTWRWAPQIDDSTAEEHRRWAGREHPSRTPTTDS